MHKNKQYYKIIINKQLIGESSIIVNIVISFIFNKYNLYTCLFFFFSFLLFLLLLYLRDTLTDANQNAKQSKIIGRTRKQQKKQQQKAKKHRQSIDT